MLASSSHEVWHRTEIQCFEVLTEISPFHDPLPVVSLLRIVVHEQAKPGGPVVVVAVAKLAIPLRLSMRISDLNHSQVVPDAVIDLFHHKNRECMPLHYIASIFESVTNSM